MSELTLTIIKLGFLAVLWLFVLSVVSVIRADLFGTRAAAAGPHGRRRSRPPRATRERRGEPSRVVVVEGASAGVTRPLLDRPLTIGRGGGCDLVVDDEYVSTRHATLQRTDGRWYVEDLGSTNGTFVSGSRIHGPLPVGIGTRVRVGKTVLELKK